MILGVEGELQEIASVCCDDFGIEDQATFADTNANGLGESERKSEKR